MLKKTLIKIKWFPAMLVNKLIMKMRNIQYGSHLTLYGRVFIRGTGDIIIGNNVTITSCIETDPIGGDSKTILYAKGGNIRIGDNTGISNTAIVAGKEINIGKNVMIGGGCKIYDNDFHSIHLENRLLSPDPDVRCSSVNIEDGVFIGAHSIILKGVTIGKESVIGAGSVVTRSIPEREIWAGNPAKFIKKIENTGEIAER